MDKVTRLKAQFVEAMFSKYFALLVLMIIFFIVLLSPILIDFCRLGIIGLNKCEYLKVAPHEGYYDIGIYKTYFVSFIFFLIFILIIKIKLTGNYLLKSKSSLHKRIALILLLPVVVFVLNLIVLKKFY